MTLAQPCHRAFVAFDPAPAATADAAAGAVAARAAAPAALNTVALFITSEASVTPLNRYAYRHDIRLLLSLYPLRSATCRPSVCTCYTLLRTGTDYHSLFFKTRPLSASAHTHFRNLSMANTVREAQTATLEEPWKKRPHCTVGALMKLMADSTQLTYVSYYPKFCLMATIARTSQWRASDGAPLTHNSSTLRWHQCHLRMSRIMLPHWRGHRHR